MPYTYRVFDSIDDVDVNAWQRGPGLVDDGTDHLRRGLRGCRAGQPQER